MTEQTLLKFYNPRRAIEHIQGVPELQPVRFFAVLFPLWYIEAVATQEEGRPYELIEEYIERGIEQGELHTVSELHQFFGLDTRLVKKVLAFLETIGHAVRRNDSWFLTPRGKRSLEEGIRYIPKQAGYKLYFDGFRSRPLRREHYGKGLQIFSQAQSDKITQHSRGGYQFHRLFSLEMWDPTALRRLELDTQRQHYNLPPEAYNLQAAEPMRVYMPMYIIETEKQTGVPYYVAYTHIKGRRDAYFEEIVNTCKEIKLALYAESPLKESDLWREWLVNQGLTRIPPVQRSRGIWQVVLDKEVFRASRTKLKVEDVGTFHLERGYFLQIWCDDPIIRREAALDRILRIIEKTQKRVTRQDVLEHLQRFTTILNTRTLLLDDLRQRAIERDLQELLELINAL